MPADRFTAVRFPVVHPALPVRDDEVVLAFHEDADAKAWREWWDAQGAEVFAHWLKRQPPRPEVDHAGHQRDHVVGSRCERCGVLRGTVEGSTVCYGQPKWNPAEGA